MKKYKKGYTTGVYDMFHIGHLNLLRNSKSLCDFLIVGVTTDEISIMRKNKKPIIPLKDRLEIIRELRVVDEVVVQDDMDKIAAWEKYKFDVMFVGDDWKGNSKWIELEDKFHELGVDIVYFPYTEKISSTKLREELTKK